MLSPGPAPSQLTNEGASAQSTLRPLLIPVLAKGRECWWRMHTLRRSAEALRADLSRHSFSDLPADLDCFARKHIVEIQRNRVAGIIDDAC